MTKKFYEVVLLERRLYEVVRIVEVENPETARELAKKGIGDVPYEDCIDVDVEDACR